jgi:hypothetical protein
VLEEAHPAGEKTLSLTVNRVEQSEKNSMCTCGLQPPAGSGADGESNQGDRKLILKEIR